MVETTPHLSKELPPETSDYSGHRLDGARDLYLLALALGDRPDGSPLFRADDPKGPDPFRGGDRGGPGPPGCALNVSAG